MLLEAKLTVRDVRRFALFPLLVRACARRSLASLAFSPQVRRSLDALLSQLERAERQRHIWPAWQEAMQGGSLVERPASRVGVQDAQRSFLKAGRQETLWDLFPEREWESAPLNNQALLRSEEKLVAEQERGSADRPTEQETSLTAGGIGSTQASWTIEMSMPTGVTPSSLRPTASPQDSMSASKALVWKAEPARTSGGLSGIHRIAQRLTLLSQGSSQGGRELPLHRVPFTAALTMTRRPVNLADFRGASRLFSLSQLPGILLKLTEAYRQIARLVGEVTLRDSQRQVEWSGQSRLLSDGQRLAVRSAHPHGQGSGSRLRRFAASLAGRMAATQRLDEHDLQLPGWLAGERGVESLGRLDPFLSFLREGLHPYQKHFAGFVERLKAFAGATEVAGSAVTMPTRSVYMDGRSHGGKRFVSYPGLPPLPLSTFSYWSGLERPARLVPEMVTFPPDALWGDIWRYYQEGQDRLQLPEKDFPYEAAGLLDPVTGEVTHPLSEPHVPEVRIERPIRHPWPQWQDWASHEIEVDLGALVTVMLGIRTFWLNFEQQLASMSAYPALTACLEYLATAIGRDGDEQLRRAFRHARWYAEAVVMRRCHFLLRRRYDPWLAVPPFGIPYENHGFWIQEGGVLTASGPATLRFVLRTWVDGFLRGSVMVPSGTAQVLLDSIPVAFFATSQNGFLVPVVAGSHDIILSANPLEGEISFTGVMVDGVRYMGAEMDFVSEGDDGTAAVSDLLTMLMQYYELHHRYKVKGSRKFWN